MWIIVATKIASVFLYNVIIDQGHIIIKMIKRQGINRDISKVYGTAVGSFTEWLIKVFEHLLWKSFMSINDYHDHVSKIFRQILDKIFAANMYVSI